MKKTWKDNNMLLKEERPGKYRYQGHDYEDFYYLVTFSYNTEEERDEAFEYFDENSSYNMTNMQKEGENEIKLIKYISNQLDPSDPEINEDIESWVDEQADETGAYSAKIEESSYDAYHDMFFGIYEKKGRKSLKEARKPDIIWSVGAYNSKDGYGRERRFTSKKKAEAYYDELVANAEYGTRVDLEMISQDSDLLPEETDRTAIDRDGTLWYRYSVKDNHDTMYRK